MVLDHVYACVFVCIGILKNKVCMFWIAMRLPVFSVEWTDI